MTDSELKPCPFCGETAKLWPDSKISCTNPGCGCFRSICKDNATPFYVSDFCIKFKDWYGNKHFEITRQALQREASGDAGEALEKILTYFTAQEKYALEPFIKTIRTTLTDQQAEIERLEKERDELREGVQNICEILNKEIKARFGCSHHSPGQAPRKSRVYSLLTVPRNLLEQLLIKGGD